MTEHGHQPRHLPVTLDGTSYQIEPALLERRFLPYRRQPVDMGTEPGEHSLSPLGAWRYTINDWSLGAGQEWQDLPDSERRQYYKSDGIWPFTRGEIRLVNDVEEMPGVTIVDDLPGSMSTFFIGDHLYAQTSHTSYHFTEEPLAAAPTWVEVTFPAGVDTLTYWASDGFYAYFIDSDNNDLYRAGIGETSAEAFGPNNVRRVWFANGHLLAWGGGSLFSIDAEGNKSYEAFFEQYAGNWTVSWVEEAPHGIYFSGDQKPTRENCRIFYIGVDDDGSLMQPREAGRLPDGHAVHNMAFYGGLLILSSLRGTRLAAINPDNSISYGPLMLERIMGQRDELTGIRRVRYMTTQGEFVYFDWGGYENVYGDHDNSRVGIMSIAEFTEPMVGKASSHILSGVTDNTRSITSIMDPFREKDYRVFTTVNRLWREVRDRVTPQGHVLSGWIRFGVSVKKIPRAIDVRHEPLPPGTSVKVYIWDEDENETHVITSDEEGSRGPDEPCLIEDVEAGHEFKILVELNRGTDTGIDPTSAGSSRPFSALGSPVVNSVTLYAIPVPTRTEEFILPIISSTTVTAEGGQPIKQDAAEVYATLRKLVSDRDIVSLEFGNEQWDVTVEDVEVRPMDTNVWDDDRHGIQSVAFVTCHTMDVGVKCEVEEPSE